MHDETLVQLHGGRVARQPNRHRGILYSPVSMRRETEVRFAADSAMEEAGFELAVPRRIVTLILVFAYVTPST